MTTHYEKIQALGNRMASNLETMGVSASFGDGGLTLADKILQIQHFTDGLLLWADKDIIQTGDTVNLYALLLEESKPVSGETILFKGLETTQTLVANTETTVSNCYKLTNVTLSGSDRIYLNEEQSIYLYFAGDNLMLYDGGSRYLTIRNEIITVENGIITVYGSQTGAKNTVDATSTNTNKITSTLSDVTITETMQGTTGSNGVATVSYTGKGAGLLNIKAIHGIIQSEIYSLIDAIVIDRATSSDYNNLFPSNMNGITRNINDSTYYIDRMGSSASNKSTASYSLSGGLCVEITLTDITTIYQLRVALQGADESVVRSISYSNITTGTIRFECLQNSTKIYMNDILIVNETENNISSLIFQIRTAANSTDNFNYKNLLIYPI